MLKHTDLPHGFCLPAERITVCTAVGIGHRDTGEQVNTVQRMFFVKTDLNVGVVITVSAIG